MSRAIQKYICFERGENILEFWTKLYHHRKFTSSNFISQRKPIWRKFLYSVNIAAKNKGLRYTNIQYCSNSQPTSAIYLLSEPHGLQPNSLRQINIQPGL